MQFTLTEFKKGFQTCGVHLTVGAPENQEMKRQVEVTWRTLRTVAHSCIVHARVLEAYIHFALIYTTYQIFLFLPIKNMINK